MDPTSKTMERAGSTIPAFTLKGKFFVNLRGEKIGILEELMIDSESRQVSYAIMAGERNKLYAIPWEVISLDSRDKCLVVDLNSETLEKLPGFTRDNYPDMTDRDWKSRGHAHFGRRPYWDLTHNKWIPGP